MRYQRLLTLIGMTGFIGAAVWACSSSTPTGFNDGNGNGSNSTNSGNSSVGNGNGTTNNYGTGVNTSTNNNTGVNTSTVGNGTSTANGTTTVGGGGGAQCGDAGGVCSAASTGGLALSSCYQSTLGSGGYAYSYGDYQTVSSCASQGSTSCVNPSSFCGSGTTVPHGDTYACYGNGIGIDLATTQAGAPGTPATVTAAGLSFTINGTLPASGGQIIVVDDTGTNYCSVLAGGATGAMTVPWSDFNTLCYNPVPDGGVFPGMSGKIAKINLQVNSGTANQTWSLCVSDISF